MFKKTYCEICGARLRWYNKRIEFTFTDSIPTEDRQDSIIYTWKEAVCFEHAKEVENING